VELPLRLMNESEEPNHSTHLY